MNMLPARDPQEFHLLPEEDVAFIARWLQWADDNVPLLQRTRVVPQLEAPSAGRLDGVVMLDTTNRGALFLFNPTSAAIPASLPLDSTLGFNCVAHPGPVVIKVLGSSDRGAAPHNLAVVECGAPLNLTVPPTTALALGFDQWGCVSGEPLVIGLQLDCASIDSSSATLMLSGVLGEAGTAATALVALPPGTPTIERVTVNGRSVSAFRQRTFHTVPTISFDGGWAGPHFETEIGSVAGVIGGPWEANFTVPTAVLKQLSARNASYPVQWDTDPDGNNDPNVPWLAPGRLLIFVKYRPLLNDSVNVTGSIDGEPLLMRKAYNTIVRSPGRFIGYWADATTHIAPDRQQTLRLELPGHNDAWVVKNGALLAGSDLTELNASVPAAEAACSTESGCVGFTWQKSDPGEACSGYKEKAKMYLKSSMSSNGDGAWCSVVMPASIVGVFFENVQTVYTAAWEVAQ